MKLNQCDLIKSSVFFPLLFLILVSSLSFSSPFEENDAEISRREKTPLKSLAELTDIFISNSSLPHAFYPNDYLYLLTEHLKTRPSLSESEEDRAFFHQGLFCLYAQRELTSRFPFHTTPFLDVLAEKTTITPKTKKNKTKKRGGKSKKKAHANPKPVPFSLLRLTKKQRDFLALLRENKMRKNLVKGQLFLEFFFNNKSQIDLIDGALSSFSQKIRKQFDLPSEKDLFDKDNLMNQDFLNFSARFGFSTAINICLTSASLSHRREELKDLQDPNSDLNVDKLLEDLQIYEKESLTQIHFIKNIAESGHAKAMCFYGNTLAKISRYQEADYWYRRAIELGNVNAIYNLAGLNLEQKKYEKARHWYTQAANLGLDDAMHNLALIFENEGNLEEAIEWYTKAAETGLTASMNNLALIYRKQGQLDAAKGWFKKGAEKGDHVCMTSLANLLYLSGEQQEGMDWLIKASQAGNEGAMNNLGNAYLENGNIEKAEYWLQESIKAGCVQSCLNLGNLYIRHGNNKKAKECFLKGESLGNIECIHNLGTLYFSVGKLEKAEKYYKKAALKGSVVSMADLGALYADCNRHQEAKEWFQKGAEKGDAECHFWLGFYYTFIKKESDLHLYHLRKAADLGCHKALLILAEELPEHHFQEKIDLYKKAISYGIKDAEVFYSIFLTSHEKKNDHSYSHLISGLKKEALEYQLDEEQESFEEGGTQQSHHETYSPEQIPDETKTLSKNPNSMALQKKYEHAKKNLLTCKPQQKDPPLKTYKDISITFKNKSEKEYEDHKFKIQNLLSYLSNGDFKRGRFERLKHPKILYSMRITRKHRLIFEITQKDSLGRVTAVTIFGAKHHYKSL